MSGAIDDANEFLEELARIASGSPRIVPPLPDGIWSAIGHLMAAATGREPDVAAERWWAEATGALLDRFPEADRFALDWLCAVRRREDEIARLAQAGLPMAYTANVWLQRWAMRRPIPGAADRLHATLRAALVRLVEERRAWSGQAPPQAHPDERGFGLLLLPLRYAPDGRDRLAVHAADLVRLALAMTRPTYPDSLPSMVLRVLVSPWLERGTSSLDERRRILLAYPTLPVDLRRDGARSRVWTGLREAIDGLLAAAVRDGTVSNEVRSALLMFNVYAGVDHFRAAVRWLERPANGGDEGWAVRVLRELPPPSTADRARVSELAGLRPAILVAAGLLNPGWAEFLEAAELSPELNGILGVALWVARFTDPAPWAVDDRVARRVEWDLGAIPAERAAMRDASAAIGAERVRTLLAHPFVKQEARIARFCLEAVLGTNAADVEAKFLKRDKWAVVALGMLPDEGDVPDRYLALRRFAQDATKSGPQRGVSEALTVQIALAHLAVTGGYDDADALEWAIETRLAANVDPAAKRWTVGGYDVWVEPVDAAPIRVERGGKRLVSVPAAIRRSSEYAAAKEARELLLAQTERVQRRLERAMVRGERFDRASYDHLLALPAGRMLLPRLVLGVRLSEAADPVETAGGRTLAGEPVALDSALEVRITHPLDLAAAGTLAAWQRRLVEDGVVQPFNQLWRGVYLPTADERASQICRRFLGRKAKLGVVRRALLRAGWEAPRFSAGFVRRFAPPAVAELTLDDYVAIGEAEAPVTIGELGFHGRDWGDRLPGLEPLWFTETVRDADLATTVALVDRDRSMVVSPEQIAVRIGLVRAFLPETVVADGIARFAGGAVHLTTGAAYDAAGHAILLPELPAPAAFPYPEPVPAVAEIVARALHLATARS